MKFSAWETFSYIRKCLSSSSDNFYLVVDSIRNGYTVLRRKSTGLVMCPLYWQYAVRSDTMSLTRSPKKFKSPSRSKKSPQSQSMEEV